MNDKNKSSRRIMGSKLAGAEEREREREREREMIVLQQMDGLEEDGSKGGRWSTGIDIC
jgi:hypothetical protein